MSIRKVLQKGVIGVDEVGRGPLAGPVTVCAFYIENEKEALKSIFSNSIRDSKKLKKDIRNNIYKTIRQKRMLKTRVEYAISSRSAVYIDKHGLSKAISRCVSSCLSSLSKKNVDVHRLPIKLDAGLKVLNTVVNQESFVKGDEKFVCIALASIMAKVHRDTLMTNLSKTYKGYGWDQNVGYGTKEHRKAIENIGITPLHRKSFLKKFKL